MRLVSQRLCQHLDIMPAQQGSGNDMSQMRPSGALSVAEAPAWLIPCLLVTSYSRGELLEACRAAAQASGMH